VRQYDNPACIKETKDPYLKRLELPNVEPFELTELLFIGKHAVICQAFEQGDDLLLILFVESVDEFLNLASACVREGEYIERLSFGYYRRFHRLINS
jgi:hypothetical protein